MIHAIKTFIKAHRVRLFEENKPHGFDVQDQRIGGLLLRLRACRERLIEYADGVVDAIPELDETLLDYRINGKVAKERSFNYNGWASNVTVNPI